MLDKLRNIAIIAHVDHGKTTLVDELLKQSGTFDSREELDERMMDSNDLEKERGITILAKNTAINWKDYHINIVDTPGHADFGGEVERVMSMVDSVLLIVDAQEGPMPQTRFVTQKAFEQGLKPIVVINKMDKPGARPSWVVDQVFDLFDNLGATDEQLDFKVAYASAMNGWATLEEGKETSDMNELFQMILDEVPFPKGNVGGPLKMQISQLDYSSYLGVIGIGRITQGTIKTGDTVKIVKPTLPNVEGSEVVVGKPLKVGQVLGYLGLERHEISEAAAGDIIAVTGLGELKISDTICSQDDLEPLVALSVDEPTVTMTFQVNTSPFAGKEGKYVTSRNIYDRLKQELVHNVALKVEETDDSDKFRVSGRGELHLGILIENMRREGYELAVSRPEVIIREVDGKKEEPYENVTIDVEEGHQGVIMEKMGLRKAEITNVVPDGKGRIRIDLIVPSRGLIGFQTEFMTITSGKGLLYHTFNKYGPYKGGDIGQRSNGVLIANAAGKALTNALFNLQERGKLLVGHGKEVYEGMIVGIHNRENDLTVNAIKGKQLTNVRSSGTDDAQVLTPHINMTLEQALEFIDDDELVEITPEDIRIRKKYLTENERKRFGRKGKGR